MAAGGSALSLVLVILFVPNIPRKSEVKSKDNDEDKYNKSSNNNLLSLSEILKVVQAPGAMLMLGIKLVCGVPIGVLQSMFSGTVDSNEFSVFKLHKIFLCTVIAMDRFGMPAEQNGMMLSYIGVISLVMQGVGISFFARYFQDKSIMNGATVALTATYYLMVIKTLLLNLEVRINLFLLFTHFTDT